MQQRVNLAEGYSVSRIINGCWQLSEGHCLQGSLDFKDIMGAFHQLAEQGLTTFDCADIYTGVEEFLGKFLQELKEGRGISPHDIQIHTKYVPDMDMLGRVDFQYTEKIIDRSLKRLGRETLDLVQFHWWDYDIPGAAEAAGHLAKLKDKGKIRHIGATNFDTKHLAEIVDAGIPVVSVQAQYSLFDRRPEKSLLRYCQSKNIAVLCYGTLAGGFLSERWRGKALPQAAETRSQVKYLQVLEDTLGWQDYQSLLVLLHGIAKKRGVSVSTLATGYILSQSGVASAIVGVRNSRHVSANASALSFEPNAEELEQICQFLQKYNAPAGEPFELERTADSKYRNIMKMNLSEQ